jgi:hypothetical protein
MTAQTFAGSTHRPRGSLRQADRWVGGGRADARPPVLAFISVVVLVLTPWAATPLVGQSAVALSPAVQGYVAVASPVMVLANVRIVDGTGAPARDGQSVVIRDGRIEAVALGIDNLEHGLFTNSDYARDRPPDTCPTDLYGSLLDVEVDGPEVSSTIRLMVENGVALTSTLSVYELMVPHRPPLEERVLEALAPEARQEFLQAWETLSAAAAESIMPEIFRRAQAFELAFVRAGGLLAAGSDPTGIGGALPGFADQRNYELLLETGFPPEEPIQIMTLNGARILGEDHRLGSVESVRGLVGTR